MFTIEARVEKSFDLETKRKWLLDFFTDLKNFPRYMPDIISNIEPKKDDRSIWTLKIDVSASSPLTVKLEMAAKQSGEGKLSYEPVAASQDHLAIYIDLLENGSRIDLNFILELRLERKSSFDIHPLAGFMGERSISKLV